MKRIKNIIALIMVALSFSCFVGGCGGNMSTTAGPINGTNLYLNKSQLTITLGKVDKLYATVDDDSNIEFKSLDTTICTVDNNGKVVALKIGATTIVVTANGEEKLCAVNVVSDGFSISFNQPDSISAVLGTTISLHAIVYKENNRIEKDVLWSSIGDNATTVVSNNTINITTTSIGFFTVSATVGQCVNTCTIKVCSNDATQLSIPILTLEENKVKWSAVDNADGYLVKIGDEQWISTTELCVDVANVKSQTTVLVKAICNEFDYFDSGSAFIVV